MPRDRNPRRGAARQSLILKTNRRKMNRRMRIRTVWATTMPSPIRRMTRTRTRTGTRPRRDWRPRATEAAGYRQSRLGQRSGRGNARGVGGGRQTREKERGHGQRRSRVVAQRARHGLARRRRFRFRLNDSKNASRRRLRHAAGGTTRRGAPSAKRRCRRIGIIRHVDEYSLSTFSPFPRPATRARLTRARRRLR